MANAVWQFVLRTTATPPATLDAVRDAVARIPRHGTADPDVRVVCNRVRGFAHERLTASNSQDKVLLAATAGEVLTGWGVGEWMGELTGVVEWATVWIAVYRGASAGFYNRLEYSESTAAGSKRCMVMSPCFFFLDGVLFWLFTHGGLRCVVDY